ncbi:MAG TPA: hypothetical protein VIN35_11810 [Hydrogenophaga sp.]
MARLVGTFPRFQQAPKPKARYVYRSAKTRRYCTKQYAARYPHLTVRERVR